MNQILKFFSLMILVQKKKKKKKKERKKKEEKKRKKGLGGVEAFKKFKTLVEKQSGYHLKAIQSDRGGELTPNAFEIFCEEN